MKAATTTSSKLSGTAKASKETGKTCRLKSANHIIGKAASQASATADRTENRPSSCCRTNARLTLHATHKAPFTGVVANCRPRPEKCPVQ